MRVVVTVVATAALALLSTLTAGAAQAAYPGGDGRIAFTRANQVFTIAANGSGLRQLTDGGKSYWPRWSPDGKRIAYVHEMLDGSKDIWVMSATGLHAQQVTHLGSVSAPTWSPDGAWIAFGSPLQRIRSHAPFGAPQPILADEEGLGVRRVVTNLAGSVAWSPDGRHIAVFTDSYPSSPDHYLVVVDTVARTTQLVGAEGGECCGEGTFADVGWSPDGRLLSYTDDFSDPEAGDPPAPNTGLALHYPGGGQALRTKAGDEQLAFSPSGRSIVVTHATGGHLQLVVATATDAGRRVLTDGYQPDWQPLH